MIALASLRINGFSDISEACFLLLCLLFTSLLIDDAGTPKRIEEHVAHSHERHHIRNHVSGSVSNSVLYHWQDAATNDHRHEDATGCGGVLAQSLCSKVERAAPHHGSAETTADEQDGTQRQLCHLETGTSEHRNGTGDGLGKHHGCDDQADANSVGSAHHHTTGDL